MSDHASKHHGLSTFLRARRATIRPADVGVVSYGARRVPGLRRDELALMAGVSVSHYTRIEQGHPASPDVLRAIGRALELTPDETRHMMTLASPPAASRKAPVPEDITPGIRALVETAEDFAFVVAGRWMDILAWNDLGHALVARHLPRESAGQPGPRPNWARMVFLDSRTRQLFVDWEAKRNDIVGHLRAQTARFPDDTRLSELVGELCLASPDFSRLWESHVVREKRPSVVRLRHPEVGTLELFNEILTSPPAPDHLLATFHAAPGTDSARALHELRASARVWPAGPTASGRPPSGRA